MLFNRNALWFGLVIGLFLPIAGYGILLVIYDWMDAAGLLSSSGFAPNFRDRTLGIVAICLNIIPLNAFQRKRFTQSMRGLVISTFIYVAIWFIYFGSKLL